MGLQALALTDHDGMYGVVRFAEAAGAAGLATIFGAEVTLGLTRGQAGVADPEGAHLVVLARGPTGYARLCKALSAAHLLGREKGRPMLDLPLLAAIGAGADIDLSSVSMSGVPGLAATPVLPEAPVGGNVDHWLVLTGCRKGPVPAALMRSGPGAARAELVRLQRSFGRSNVAVEIWDHGEPLASARNDALVEVACRAGADVVATNNVHYHRPGRGRLATAVAAVRGRRSLDDIDGWLPAAACAHLRSGAEQERRFARYPGVVAHAAELGMACAFDLKLVAPQLPPFPTPPGHSEMSWLRHLTEEGARRRYGPRETPNNPKAYPQIEYELDMIGHLGFPGYFLIVWDIVRFCNEAGIFCQGRGSAANSAVCYTLGITKADAVGLGLLFERFLSPERDGPPDIDVDIESQRREEAIQYVYRRYGRSCAAQVANVITYRPRSAVRDMGKALGASQGQVDAWSKCIDAWGPLPGSGSAATPETSLPGSGGAGIPEPVLDLARQVLEFPRHLGIHSGGMVICDRPVAEVCPVEWARMADRSVLQWDKEDCARAGLVKFDMLGLGMLSALHATVDHIKAFYGIDLDLAALPGPRRLPNAQQSRLGRGFPSREQGPDGNTPPLAAAHLLRPGDRGRPYTARPDPGTLGSPLPAPSQRHRKDHLPSPFIGAQPQKDPRRATFPGAAHADGDRRGRFQRRRSRSIAPGHGLQTKCSTHGAPPGTLLRRHGRAWRHGARGRQDLGTDGRICQFWLPRKPFGQLRVLGLLFCMAQAPLPSCFFGRLAGQPADGILVTSEPRARRPPPRRQVRRPDVNASEAASLLEPIGEGARPSGAPGHQLRAHDRGRAGEVHRRRPAVHRYGRPRPSVQFERCPSRSPRNRRCPGVLRFEPARGAVGRRCHRPCQLRPGQTAGRCGERYRATPAPGDGPCKLNRADLWATGLSPDSYPTELFRPELDARGVVKAADLSSFPNGAAIVVGGLVTHRQRPATANGVIFVNLEDETGLVNVICPLPIWQRYGPLARTAPALLVRGKLEKADGAINVLAVSFEALPAFAGAGHLRSRDFH